MVSCRAPGFVPKFRPPEFSHCEKSSHDRDWIFGPKKIQSRLGGPAGSPDGFFFAARPAGVVTGFFRGARRRGVVTGFFFAAGVVTGFYFRGAGGEGS